MVGESYSVTGAEDRTCPLVNSRSSSARTIQHIDEGPFYQCAGYQRTIFSSGVQVAHQFEIITPMLRGLLDTFDCRPFSGHNDETGEAKIDLSSGALRAKKQQ